MALMIDGLLNANVSIAHAFFLLRRHLARMITHGRHSAGPCRV
jgi:hypothetical protein